jgi:hypothetical protein
LVYQWLVSIAGGASLSSGFALVSLLAWLWASHAQFDWFILLGWNGLTGLFFVLAPNRRKRTVLVATLAR